MKIYLILAIYFMVAGFGSAETAPVSFNLSLNDITGKMRMGLQCVDAPAKNIYALKAEILRCRSEIKKKGAEVLVIAEYHKDTKSVYISYSSSVPLLIKFETSKSTFLVGAGFQILHFQKKLMHENLTKFSWIVEFGVIQK